MKVELVCNGCQRIFQKQKKEYDRQVRKGKMDFYCSRQCFGKHASAKNLDTEKVVVWRNSDRNRNLLTKRNKERERNPFKCYLHHIRKRHHLVLDVDEQYLKELWEKQSGKCAFSGLVMDHSYFDVKTDTFTTASLDRIDSSRGYIKGNVQFVIRALNLAKGAEADERFRVFLDRLKKALDGTHHIG